jgi:hypothetical protein
MLGIKQMLGCGFLTVMYGVQTDGELATRVVPRYARSTWSKRVHKFHVVNRPQLALHGELPVERSEIESCKTAVLIIGNGSDR